ncbi:ribonuclease T2 family protein [Methylocella sp.]|uniref:ribonuclease T2 family protein n=1 Tax=Methylocella sp. TaxID=1978226 RepID=UPI003784EDE0
MRLLRALALAAVLLPLHTPAPRAQDADDCVLDECAGEAPDAAPNSSAPDAGAAVPLPAPASPDQTFTARRGPRGASGVAGDFDFYVLALSWSPSFCRTPAGERAQDQCAPGAGLGFVTHGLWPQYERGYPQYCRFGAPTPSRIALAQAAGVYPSESLARHEWRAHGVCSGKSPTDYFADVRRARALVTIPPAFASPQGDQNWARLDIERAFLAANPRLRPGMMGIACRRSALAEVRICLTKDLRDFRACPEVARPACPPDAILAPGLL